MNNPIYQKNFQSQFLERFIKEKSKYTDFKKFDFSKIKAEVDRLKIEKK